MRKPNNYENTQPFRDYQPLPPGGYVCRVCKVEEVQSKNNKDMWNIWLDIEEGEHREKFTQDWKTDTRKEKRWGCIVYQLTEDEDGNASRGLKTFLEAVALSNPGFDESQVWQDGGETYLKNKLVGGLFRREEYLSRSGERKFSVKCCSFKSAQLIREGEFHIPEDKLLNQMAETASYPSFSNNSFQELEDDSDLPF